MFDFEENKKTALKVINRLCRKKPKGVTEDEILQSCREAGADRILSEVALIHFEEFEWTVEEDGLIRLTKLGKSILGVK